jgi:hypothetical protein
MTRLSKVAAADKDFLKYIKRKMVAWFRRFPPKKDPDLVEKTQLEEPGDDDMGALLPTTALEMMAVAREGPCRSRATRPRIGM